MNRYNAVIFDMDGLIIDTEKLLIKYWVTAANEFGYPMKREHALHIRSLSGALAEPYLREAVCPDFDYKKVRSRRIELMNADIAKNGIELKKGIIPLLDELDRRHMQKAVCTATDLERTTRYLTSLNIFHRFDKVICGPMVEHGKPAPDIYLYACGELGESPERCLALEDSPNGVRSAYYAGCGVVMVPDLTEPTEEDRKCILGEASDLEAVIKYL
ncbi:MAG: HAD family phosphatase [Oscillospiraceae bacterium]|nr:HAD family phosphatase [Oscillospiraceae bacterium]MDY2847215.1 HAD family phosphatase [Oscillospiraceae bacterium]